MKLFFYTKNKLFVSYLVFLALFFGLMQIFYKVSTDTIMENAKSNSHTGLMQIGYNFDSMLHSIDNLSMSVVSNRTIKNMLNETNDLRRGENQRVINSILWSIHISNDTILDLILLDNMGLMYGVQSFSQPNVSEKYRRYFQRAMDARGQNLWLGLDYNIRSAHATDKNNNKEYIFPSVASLTDYYSGASLGILIINIKAESLRTMLSSTATGEDSELFLLDDSGTVLMRSREEVGVLPELDSAALTEASGSLAFADGRENYLLTYMRNERTGWLLAEVISVDSMLTAAKNVKSTFLFIGVFLCLFGIIWALALSRNITRDVTRIYSVLGEAQKGNFSVAIRSSRRD